jgi:hypothetical protein
MSKGAGQRPGLHSMPLHRAQDPVHPPPHHGG